VWWESARSCSKGIQQIHRKPVFWLGFWPGALCCLVSYSLLVAERFGTQAHREGFHIDSWTFKMAAINQTLIGISPVTPPLSKCQGLELPNGGMSTDADGAYSRGPHTQGDYPMGWPEMLVYRAFQQGQVRWLGEVCTKATG
jgi:hypothetical protein